MFIIKKIHHFPSKENSPLKIQKHFSYTFFFEINTIFFVLWSTIYFNVIYFFFRRNINYLIKKIISININNNINFHPKLIE